MKRAPACAFRRPGLFDFLDGLSFPASRSRRLEFLSLWLGRVLRAGVRAAGAERTAFVHSLQFQFRAAGNRRPIRVSKGARPFERRGFPHAPPHRDQQRAAWSQRRLTSPGPSGVPSRRDKSRDEHLLLCCRERARPPATRPYLLITSALMITTGSRGTSENGPLVMVGTALMASTTSLPSTTLPKTA